MFASSASPWLHWSAHCSSSAPSNSTEFQIGTERSDAPVFSNTNSSRRKRQNLAVTVPRTVCASKGAENCKKDLTFGKQKRREKTTNKRNNIYLLIKKLLLFSCSRCLFRMTKVNSWANSAHSVHWDREHPAKNHRHTHMDAGNATCKTLPLISSNVFRSYYSIVCLSLFVFAFLLSYSNAYGWLEIEPLFAVTLVKTNAHTRPWNRMEWNGGEQKPTELCARIKRQKNEDAASGSISKEDFHIFRRCVDSRALDFWMHTAYTQQTNRLVWVMVI